MGKSHRQMLEKLRDCASTQQQAPLLQNYLQSQNLPSKGTVKLNALFKKAVLVTLHCNRMSFAPYKPLDLGIATYVQRVEELKALVLIKSISIFMLTLGLGSGSTDRVSQSQWLTALPPPDLMPKITSKTSGSCMPY